MPLCVLAERLLNATSVSSEWLIIWVSFARKAAGSKPLKPYTLMLQLVGELEDLTRSANV